MMALETSVRECCCALSSARATERKKNGEILKDFLIRNAVPSLLSENTIKKQGYSWNNVFDDIHDFVLKVYFMYCLLHIYFYRYDTLYNSLEFLHLKGMG